MTTRHLKALLTATIALMALAAAALVQARRLEASYVHGLGHAKFDQTMLGSALQAEAFRHEDLLPLYGSSEVVYDSQFHAMRLFEDYPTGFRVFEVASLGALPLMHALRLAGVGSALRGRRVVISMTPTSIYRPMQVPVYTANFSRLQATSLIFSLELPVRLKQRVAQRMLNYPRTLDGDPLLRTAVYALDDGSFTNRALYIALVPLGVLQESMLRLLDHWEILSQGTKPGRLPKWPKVQDQRSLDWPTLAAAAQRVAERRANNNEFGIDNDLWNKQVRQLVASREPKHRLAPTVDQVAPGLRQRGEGNWVDLDLLLAELETFGAKTLVLSAPFKGPYYDFWGVDLDERRAYYKKLRRIAARHHTPVIDFEDFDGDRYFVTDASSHFSAKAWVYCARIMDEFFHDRPVTQPEAEFR